jgi:hypothetical protein
MSDLETDIHATSAELTADAKRLADIERQKAEMDVSNPRLRGLAIEAERVVGVMARKAAAERVLAEQASEEK